MSNSIFSLPQSYTSYLFPTSYFVMLNAKPLPSVEKKDFLNIEVSVGRLPSFYLRDFL